MNSEFDGNRQVLVHDEKSPEDKDFKTFNCTRRNIDVTWRRCIDNYVQATSWSILSKTTGERKFIRPPKASENWAEQCAGCEIGRAIRTKFSES